MISSSTMSKEVVKMKQGMSYSGKEKTIILNVFKYFCKSYQDKSITEIVKRTAKATGCSEKSIFQFRKEESSPEGFKEPSKTKIRKRININSRFVKYNESVRESIKSIICNLKHQNILPSLTTILKNINSNEDMPNFSLMTLRRLLLDMGFTYEKEKTSNKSVLVEKNKDDIKVLNKINKIKDPMKPIITQNLPEVIIKSENQQIIIKSEGQQFVPIQNSEATTHSQLYVPQSHMQVPVRLPHHDNYVMPVGFQHSMMLNHGMPHSMHPHNLGFIHHTHQPHNSLIQH